MINYCIECGCPISSNRSVRCRKHNGERKRAIEENRRRFRHRAAQTTQAEKVAMARQQTVRLCDVATGRE